MLNRNIVLALQLSYLAFGNVIPVDQSAVDQTMGFFTGHACPPRLPLAKAECTDIKTYESTCGGQSEASPYSIRNGQCPRGTFCFDRLGLADSYCKPSVGHFYDHFKRVPAVTSIVTKKRTVNVQHTCARTTGDQADHKTLMFGDQVRDGRNIMILLHNDTPVGSTTEGAGDHTPYLRRIFDEVPAGTRVTCKMSGEVSGWVWLSVTDA